MSKYWLINITGTGPDGAVDIWLTSDGTETGRPCKTAIPQAENLLTPAAGNTTVSNLGTAFTEIPLVSTGGRPFEIQIAFCPSSVYEDLKELIDFCVAEATAVDIVAVAEPGTFDVSADPHFAPVPIGWDSFSTDTLRGLKLRFITRPAA